MIKKKLLTTVFDAEVINHPLHYAKGAVECIDAIKTATQDCDGVEGYLIGNIIKYLWRWKNKNGWEDCEKAQWYLNELRNYEYEKSKNRPNSTVVGGGVKTKRACCKE